MRPRQTAAEHSRAPCVLHNTLTAAALNECVCSKRHIFVIRADNEQVVCIVCNGGSHCAALDVESLDKANAVLAGLIVALEDECLQNILLHIAL